MTFTLNDLKMEQPPIPESGHSGEGSQDYVASNWRVQTQEKLNDSIKFGIFILESTAQTQLMAIPGILPTDAALCVVRIQSNPVVVILRTTALQDSLEVEFDKAPDIGMELNYVVFMSRDASNP